MTPDQELSLLAERYRMRPEDVGTLPAGSARLLAVLPPPKSPPRDSTTALYLSPGLVWLRVRGYGLWAKWSAKPDLFTTRKHAHYLGRLRWKVLRP